MGAGGYFSQYKVGIPALLTDMNLIQADRPGFRQLLKSPVHLLAFGFGAGLCPKAPGTAGTLVGVVIFLLLSQLSLLSYLAVTVGLAIAGCYICGKTARDLNVHDHQGIVWDEIVGYLLAMSALPVTLPWIVAGFVLFRIFDIWKPWPIYRLDREVSGGLGIMLDDLSAGLCAWMLLYACYLWL